MRTLILVVVFFAANILGAQTPLKVTHVVKKGETLYKISRDYEMTVSELRELNPQVGILQPGMKLMVIKKIEVQSRQKHHIEHKVKKGETLYRISQNYKVKVSEIREANGLLDNKISIGQVLKIPSEIEVVDETSADTKPNTRSFAEEQKAVVMESVKKLAESESGDDIKGGIIEKRTGSTKTEFMAKNDTKRAEFLDTTSANSSVYAHKAFVWVAGVPANQVICVINTETAQMAYGLNQGKRDKQSAENIVLTPFMAEKLGLKSPATELKIQYVVPKP